ncbi:hypothetical protein PBI_ANJALI_18 [Arthrobacter phage Anjali]|uniref:Uncharacterized protein n=1 Tax=Arthrobacter phage Anjali TaxID=2484217 RepID=A0A3G3LY04_9CAUD|nr:membrane protein [Arthrobacter phage Anjali]AYQ98988.1 hypothetical protein PBI_ANJALI_18 [Arthrobacter phage Anjali]
MSLNGFRQLFREPWMINAAQILQYLVAVLAGFMAALGVANPQFLAQTVSAPMIVGVGVTLIIGGAIGALSVSRGMWWLERIALWIVGVGLGALLIPATYYAFNGRSPAIWLVLFLVVYSLCDVFKRYRRIDWAYLDPAK